MRARPPEWRLPTAAAAQLLYASELHAVLLGPLHRAAERAAKDAERLAASDEALGAEAEGSVLDDEDDDGGGGDEDEDEDEAALRAVGYLGQIRRALADAAAILRGT